MGPASDYQTSKRLPRESLFVPGPAKKSVRLVLLPRGKPSTFALEDRGGGAQVPFFT
jgi:hypothetical protein